MTEIRDLLHRASEPEADWAVDRQALVAAGHRRVARRRLAAVTCAVVVTAAATVVGLTTLIGAGDPQTLVTDRQGDPGNYNEVRVPVAEVERRCSLVLNQQRVSDDQGVPWVAGRDAEGRGVSAATTSQVVENREGYAVTVIPAGVPWPEIPDGAPSGTGGVGAQLDRSADCLIPQESMLDDLETSTTGETPGAEDHAAVLAYCSTHVGYDVTGWTVLAAVEAFGEVDVVAMSDNGYAAACSIFPGGADLALDERRYLPSDPDQYPAPEAYSCQGSDQGAVECTVTGVLPGLPDGYRIALSLPDGDVVTTTTHEGAFATAFETTTIPDRLPVEVSTADGDVVWRGRW